MYLVNTIFFWLLKKKRLWPSLCKKKIKFIEKIWEFITELWEEVNDHDVEERRNKVTLEISAFLGLLLLVLPQ